MSFFQDIVDHISLADLGLYLEMELIKPDEVVAWLNHGGGFKYKHDSHQLEEILPLILQLPIESQIEFFKFDKKTNKIPPLLDPDLVLTLLPLLERLGGNSVYQLLRLPDEQGRTLLHLPRCVERVSGNLKKIGNVVLFALLSIPDNSGNTPLHINRAAILLLDVFPATQIAQLLDKRNKDGDTPLHTLPVVKHAGNPQPSLPTELLDRLQILDRKSFIDVLCRKDHAGLSLFHKPEKLSCLIPYLRGQTECDTGMWKIFLCNEDDLGRIPLHDQQCARVLIPVMNDLQRSVGNEICLALFKHEDKAVKTPLSDPMITQLSLPILSHFTEDEIAELYAHPSVVVAFKDLLDSLKNLHWLESLFRLRHAKAALKALGLVERYSNVNTWQTEQDGIILCLLRGWVARAREHHLLTDAQVKSLPSISDSWLTKAKSSERVIIPSPVDYKRRSIALGETLKKLWHDLSFVPLQMVKDQNLVPDTLLEGRTADAIWKDIETMLNRIRDVVPWLGTPPAVIETDSAQEAERKVEALYRFYTPILMDAEEIAEQAQSKSNLERAGYLISFAKPQTEARCAAAYKEEIRQTRLLISGQTEQAVENMPAVCLQLLIEEIIANKYHNDVHYLTQLRFAVGLEEVGDPLPPLSLQDAQNVVLSHWTISKIITLMKTLGLWEDMVNFLKAKTPPKALPVLSEIIDMTREKEKALVSRTRQALLNYFSEAMVKKLVQYFMEDTSVSLGELLNGCEIVEEEDLIDSLLIQTNDKLTKMGIEISREILLSKDSTPEEIARVLTRKLTGANRLKASQLLAVIKEATDQIKAITAFQRKMDELSDWDPNLKKLVLSIFCDYKRDLKDIGREFARDPLLSKFVFNSAEFNTPSQAMENHRQILHNEIYLKDDSRNRVYIKMLQLLGVIESPDENWLPFVDSGQGSW